MGNLADRCRGEGKSPYLTGTDAGSLLVQAADEIEQLLTLLRDCCDAAANGQPASRAFIRARALLGHHQQTLRSYRAVAL